MTKVSIPASKLDFVRAAAFEQCREVDCIIGSQLVLTNEPASSAQQRGVDSNF